MIIANSIEEQRNVYLLKINSRIDEWTQRINLIRRKVDNRSLHVQNDYHHNITYWRDKKENLQLKLAEISKRPINDFESLRFSAQRAYNEAILAYNKFSEFKVS